MGLYLGGLIIRRLVSDIRGAYLWVAYYYCYYYFIFFVFFFLGGGVLSEFYGIFF